MNAQRASYSRYYQPGYLSSLSLSLSVGAIATAITYPIDYIKTIIQFRSQGVGLAGPRYKVWTLGYNPLNILKQMHERGGGLRQFYSGFQSGLLSRVSYLCIRNSIYNFIYNRTKPAKPSNDLTNRQKMVIAGFAGGFAAWITTPFTVINIRQILDSQIKPEWRRNYTDIGSALKALGNQKFAGAQINIIRHVLLNVTLTAPYDYFQEYLYLRFGDYGFVKPISILLATAFSSLIVLPFDNIRTRLMYAHSDPSRNKMNYRGIVNVIVKSHIYERSHFALLAGYYTFFTSNLLYAYLTIGITTKVINSIKHKNGLKQWQI